MSELRVAIRDTFSIDWSEIVSLVTLKVSTREAQRAVRGEVRFIVQEMCARILDTPYINEETLALHLCKEGLADPKPAWNHPAWVDWVRRNPPESTS
jgi:hypothetical protein